MKTEVVLAFSQMPEAMQTPFQALYPEIVPETPVTIVVDRESRALDFTVGAREMSFGPSNENYSVFLQGCYRMLFSAAQKQGWLSQLPVEGVQQAPVEEPVQEAAAAPIKEAPVAPPPPPPEAPKQASARLASLESKLASLPITPEVEALKVKLASLKVKTASSDPNPKPEDKLYVRPLDFVNTLRADWNSWAEQHGGQDSMNKHGVLDLMNTHKASMEDSEGFGFEHTASTPWENPKGIKMADDSKLVAQLRGASTKVAAEPYSAELAQLMAQLKANPKDKNLQDEIKDLKAIIRESKQGSAKKADVDPNTDRAEDDHKGDAAYETALKEASTKEAMPAAIGNATTKVMEALKEGKPAKSGNLVSDGTTVSLHGNPIFKLENGVASASWCGWVTPTTARVVNGLAALLGVQAHFNIKDRLAQCNGKKCDSKNWVVLGSYEPTLKEASTKIAAEVPTSAHDESGSGDVSQILGHTDNPVESLADGSTGAVNITADDTINKLASVKEVATAKSASSLDFRSDSHTSSVKKAYTPEVSDAVNKFLRNTPAGTSLTLPELKSQVKGISGVWKEMLQYMQDFGLLAVDGPGRVKVLNRDAAADNAPSHMGASKVAHSDRKWVLPDGSMIDVNGDTSDDTCDYHSTIAEKNGFSGSYAAKKEGWFRIGINRGNAYVDGYFDAITREQLHKIQIYLMGLSPRLVHLEDAKNYNSLEVPAAEFYMANSGKDLLKAVRNVYASVKKARQCDAPPVETTFATFPIRIDCPAGCTATGTDSEGNPWERVQSVNYGEIINTEGGDGEAIDVFLGPDTNAQWVFIINQTKGPAKNVDPQVLTSDLTKGEPDEIKVGLGFWSLEDAKEAYLSKFPEGWANYDTNIVTTSVDSLRDWMSSHHGAKEVTADDFTLTTETPELVQPTPVLAPDVFRSISNAPITSYVASVEHDVPTPHQADVLSMFQNPATRPMDHTSAKVANLFAKQTIDPTRGHQASFDAHSRTSIEDAVKVSIDTHKANLLTPTALSDVRLAAIITADLNIGMSPDECEHRASTVSYFGSDQQTFRKTLAKLAGVAGCLVLQPNLIKNSCNATHAALTGQHKASRSKTAYHSVASTAACAGCTNYRCKSNGSKHCALYSRPIVASVEEMHKLADTVWGTSSEAKTPLGLNKRATAHLASKHKDATKSPIQHITAAVDFGDGAESRPTPSVKAASKPTMSPSTYIVSALSQGQSPARIAEVLDRSTVHTSAFKEAALHELDTQKGLMGFLTVMPHFAGSCSATHGKHFAANAKDKRKIPFHSVTKIAACNNCKNCVNNASGGSRCSLYGKPLVATLSDMKKVASTVFPALAPKLAAATKADLAKEALPYLAQALGVSENHPSLKAFQMPTETPEPVETEIDKVAVDNEKEVVEGTSKNVMDIALQAAKPKTQDLEAITIKIKEAFVAKKTPQQVYDAMKTAFRTADRPQLQRLVRKIAGDISISQSKSNSSGEVQTSVSTTDNAFGELLKQLTEQQIAKTQPVLTDNIVDVNEMVEKSDDPDEFNVLQGYVN